MLILNKRHYKTKKAITLVELVVAMALIAIFAVACVSLILPISTIYTHHNELAKAQLIADNVASSLRGACTGNNIECAGDVWITSNGYELVSENDSISSLPSGEVLVIRKSPEYCISIGSNYEITGELYNAVKTSEATDDSTDSAETGSGGLYSRAIYRMFNSADPAADQVASGIGRVHYGYFSSGTNVDSFVFPNGYYDFTDPLTNTAYGKYTVDLSFSDLTYDVDTGAPAYVKCLITVNNDQGVAYTRTIALHLS